MPENSNDILAEYRRIFSGAQDGFIIHVPPFEKSADGRKLNAAWVGWAIYGKSRFKTPNDGYDVGDYVPAAAEQFKAHLNGEYGLAISPLIRSVRLTDGERENVCAYGIIDIDVYGVDFTPFIRRLYDVGFKFSAFRSKSGGLHIYFIFSTYENTSAVRAVLQKIVAVYALDKLYRDTSKNISKVEVFPERDECKPGIKNKGVLLPFFNSVGESPNQLITADGSLVGIVKAIPLIKSQFTTVSEMQTTVNSLPYADAPYCVQALLLSGALQEGAHRNDFLFTSSLYLKLKYGKDALTLDMISDMNERLEAPLETEHVEAIYKSVTTNDYPILGQCKKQPMCAFCDKKACKERKFSAVQKEKNNVSSNIDFGQVFRMKAETPYYLLEARLAGTDDEYKMLHVDEAENFLSQRIVQKECIDKLGQVMWTVKQQIWEERLNDVLSRMQEKEVARETDTTEMSDLRDLFYRYLTHAQTVLNTPSRINMKQVYFASGVYYFKTDGFKDYLRSSKYMLGRTNLRERLVSYGCKEGEVSYSRKDGSTAVVKCWLKETDNDLKAMEVVFDEITEDDNLVIERNKLHKGARRSEESIRRSDEQAEFSRERF